jgi:hypothetical protein
MVVILVALLSAQMLASFPESIKTGSSNLKPTTAELKKAAHNLTSIKKEELHFKQLREIISKEITDNISYEILQKVDFSLTDSDLTRAKKYERLGLMILNSDNYFQNRNYLIYLSFEKAVIHSKIATTQIENKVRYKFDYYMSTAQLSFWAARFADIKKELIETSKKYLRKAVREINNLPTQEEFNLAESYISQTVANIVQNTSEENLSNLALDPLTKIALEDFSEQYIQKRITKTKERLLKNEKLDPQIIDNALQKYGATLTKNMQSQQRTLIEKRHLILQQDFLKLYQALLLLGLVEEKDSRYIHINHLEEIASLENNFQFIEQDDFAQNLKKTLQHSTLLLHNSLSK